MRACALCVFGIDLARRDVWRLPTLACCIPSKDTIVASEPEGARTGGHVHPSFSLLKVVGRLRLL